MAVVDSSQLSAELQESKKDFEKIFALKVRDGFGRAKKRFTTLRTDEKAGLKREFMGNITQPGRTGNINNATEFLSWKDKVPVLKPAKVDLTINEVELHKMRVSFLNKIESADPNDIHSIAGRSYIMSRVMKQIGKEVHAAIYRSALGFGYDGTNAGTIASSSFQGGLNLFDGLGVKFLEGYTTVANGGKEDIPAAQKVANPDGAGFTSTTAIAELGKMLEIIYYTPELQDIAISDDAEDENTLILPPAYALATAQALDNLPYKSSKLVEPKEGGGWRFKSLPNVGIEMDSFMSTVDNMFWGPKSNLFWLSPMSDDDVASIKFQEVGRGVQILIDWEQNVDYADGRQLVLYK